MTLDPRTLLLMMDLTCLRPGNTLFPGGGLRRSQRPQFHRWEPLWHALGWIALILMCLTVSRRLRGFWSEGGGGGATGWDHCALCSVGLF